MSQLSLLEQGREAVTTGSWRDAQQHLTAADELDPLEAPDVERLALASFMVGMDVDSTQAWSRAYQARIHAQAFPDAARCAFWAGFQSFVVGDFAASGGWLARLHGCLEDCPDDCVERGYALIPGAIQLVEEGNADAAKPMFDSAVATGKKFSDPTLLALGHLGQAHVWMLLGEVERGLQMLDEVMVSITAREVAPNITGIVYCATIVACQEAFDVRRAHEWTRALSSWCDEQQDLVPFRGQCLVHRAELMQLRGEWADALREVGLARERLSSPPGQGAIGMAYYEEGELHRLRGELTQAEAALQHAHQLGHPAQPALALLWLQQGKADLAASAIKRSLADEGPSPQRARMLAGAVDILLAADALPDARACADELAEISQVFGAPFLSALSQQQLGAVTLAEKQPDKALKLLREAWRGFQDLGAPYEAARVRVLIGQAFQQLGESDIAAMEFDAARISFQSLGAASDLVALDSIGETGRPQLDIPLTQRELEVLQMLATGATNRQIATVLVISEKTVGRHVANIYAKLNVSSRSAATAYAYEHGLARST